jgi:peptide chain release factor 1
LVEIRAAEGGNDAKLLVEELFQVYIRWCRIKNLKLEMLYAADAEVGGFSRVEFITSGTGAFNAFASEAGGHRFQRVPPTEKRGRRQTSTVTVAVLEMIDDVDLKINQSDLEWEFYIGSGPGGQHKQKNETAVRLKHLPSGIVVNCQDSRHRHRNQERALEILRAKLGNKIKCEQAEKENKDRKKQIGSGMRGDKVRTYRFQDDRAIDHRTGKKVKLSKVLNGDLSIFK